ncbi:PAS domain-containing protein, partial [Acinetobacter baumannii]
AMDVSLSPGLEKGVDLWGAAFDFAAEPMMLLDPHGDCIVDANPAVCALLGYDRALLRQMKISALHAGQVPALIVFTQAVFD